MEDKWISRTIWACPTAACSLTHVLLQPVTCLQVESRADLDKPAPKSFPGNWTDVKITIIFIQTQNKANGSAPSQHQPESPSRAGRVRPEGADWAAIRFPHEMNPLPAPPSASFFPWESNFLPLLAALAFRKCSRVPESEVICFCCIGWNIVAYSSQCLSHFLKSHLPMDWHSCKWHTEALRRN